MANDLSDISETIPAATDAISLGDDEIRKTKFNVKNWATQDLGNTAAEHYNDGPHRFLRGPSSTQLPAAGHAGRIFHDTENTWQSIDDGTNWVLANAVGVVSVMTPTAVTIQISYTQVQAITLFLPIGGRLLVYFSAEINIPDTSLGAETLYDYNSKITYDSTTILNPGVMRNKDHIVGSNADVSKVFRIAGWAIHTTPANGQHTVALEIKNTDATTTATNRFMIAMVV